MNVHVTEESRSLRCDLTNIERLEKGRALAEADAECARIEEEKAQVATQYAARLKTATSRRHELAGAIRQGYEFRDVICRVQFIYPDREVVVAREDTGEVIERRGMNPTELRQAERRAQGDLFPELEPEAEGGEEAAPAVQLADTDPDVVAAKAEEEDKTAVPVNAEPASVNRTAGFVNTDATAPGAGKADAPADAQINGEAAAEPTPAGEAASPAEPEHQRKPRSDKGKPRGPRKVEDVIKSIHPTGTVTGQTAHEPDARDPGFTTQPAGEPPEPPATENEPEIEEAPELPGDEPDPETCERCGHSENVHGDSGMRGCMVDGCECRKLRLPLDDPDPLHLDGYVPGERADTKLSEEVDAGGGEVGDASA